MSLAEVQNAVAKLPENDRARLAAWILENIPRHGEEDAISDSIAEAERREAEMDAGITKPLSEAEFWASLNRDRSQCG